MPNGKTDVIKAMGDTKWGDIELKRGIDQDKTLWNWRKMIVDGPVQGGPQGLHGDDARLHGLARRHVLDHQRVAEKYTGVGLKADSNEVAVEGITLCHEGFEIK